MPSLRPLVRLATRAVSRAAWLQIRPLTRSGWVPPSIWKRIPVENTFEVAIADPAEPGRADRFRYRSTYGDVIGRALCWRGLDEWEHETIRAFVPLARRARRLLDVGANTGTYSLIAAAVNPVLEAIAFEPLPAALGRLRDNIALNGWQDRIEVIDAAVSDSASEVQFHKPFGELPTSASLAVRGFRGIPGTLITVRQVTVDDVVGDRPVDLVKVDVEGFEHKALAGMRRLLARDHPDVFAECNADGPYRAVEAELARHGYRFVHLAFDGRHRELTHIDPTLRDASRNVLCTVRTDWARRLAGGKAMDEPCLDATAVHSADDVKDTNGSLGRHGG